MSIEIPAAAHSILFDLPKNTGKLDFKAHLRGLFATKYCRLQVSLKDCCKHYEGKKSAFFNTILHGEGAYICYLSGF